MNNRFLEYGRGSYRHDKSLSFLLLAARVGSASAAIVDADDLFRSEQSLFERGGLFAWETEAAAHVGMLLTGWGP